MVGLEPSLPLLTLLHLTGQSAYHGLNKYRVDDKVESFNVDRWIEEFKASTACDSPGSDTGY